MQIADVQEKWTAAINQVTIGATKAEGGTRSRTITVGGETTLPFLTFEGAIPNKPVIAGYVADVVPDWPDMLVQAIGKEINSPVEWAQKCVQEFKVDLISLKMIGADPAGKDRPAADCAKMVQDVLKAVDVPLIVYGSGHEEKDAKVMEAVSNVAPKERLLLGHAEESAYKSIAAAAMANDHAVISFANLDVNLSKQINILLTDFGARKERIVLDPLFAALGMGLEYSYSVMERIRLAALMGDSMLQVPLICDTTSAWKAKEASEELEGHDGLEERAIWWEATTALAALVSGADALIMRSPRAAGVVDRKSTRLNSSHTT